MQLAPKADEIAKTLKGKIDEWDNIRDLCDQLTYAELDTFQLDLLTDMVVKRLNRRAR